MIIYDPNVSHYFFLITIRIMRISFYFQPKYIPPQRQGYEYPKPSIPFELPAVRVITTTTRKPVPITYLPPTTPAVCIKFHFILKIQNEKQKPKTIDSF